MKRQFSFLWAIFAFVAALSACSPYIPSRPAPGPETALVKIECRDVSVRQIMELLRSGRGKDINTVTGGSCLEITAAFSPADTPPWKLQQILQNLNDLNGVLHVELVENPHPVKQNFPGTL